MLGAIPAGRPWLHRLPTLSRMTANSCGPMPQALPSAVRHSFSTNSCGIAGSTVEMGPVSVFASPPEEVAVCRGRTISPGCGNAVSTSPKIRHCTGETIDEDCHAIRLKEPVQAGSGLPSCSRQSAPYAFTGRTLHLLKAPDILLANDRPILWGSINPGFNTRLSSDVRPIRR